MNSRFKKLNQNKDLMSEFSYSEALSEIRRLREKTAELEKENAELKKTISYFLVDQKKEDELQEKLTLAVEALDEISQADINPEASAADASHFQVVADIALNKIQGEG